jgi:hypothetical protein
LFNVAPEQVAKLPLTAVCLDYGKPTPRAAMKYEVKPIASVTDKEGVAEVCEMLGRGEIGQSVAQLAAWHLNNGLSWEKLSHLQQRGALGMVPTYTSRQIAAAKQAVEKACKTAQEHRPIEKGQAKEPGKLSGRTHSESLSAD